MFSWWHWSVLGLAILIGDVAVAGGTGIILWFGAGAVGVGLFLLADPDLPLWIQISLWMGFSIALLILWLAVFKPRANRRSIVAARQEIIGEVGVVIRAGKIDEEIRGAIRFQKPIGGRDVWQFQADSVFSPGERATVASVNDDGVLIVGKENS